ncbi:Toxin RTX-I translocation ATP-binding protein [Usitatibacter rugosus]|uniref:Cyclolysin secretion/processing ATP-binding protein CyaB n=1 Tax=Usitatibacter rugosus TaxID=2732067 RepID=A0A6M4H239_9PROT|nr:peptidase domain-containing ABC transporter [Usitatibacter rugosus]QJR12773.1 Toxin RTX-I translocation ATP-binding protein [Usitatibacter rugosus]
MEALGRLELGLRQKLPVFLQTEAAECGLASLGMIANFHGHRIDLAGLRRRFTVSLKGATLSYLMQIAGALHLTPRPLRLELAELSSLRTPCILHWDLNHFVVLRSADARHAVIHDPAFGVRRLTMAEVSKHFTGIALEATPTSEFKAHDERRRLRLRDLTGSVVGLKRSLLQVLLLALALQGFAMIAPFYMQWVVDGAVVSADRDLLTVLGLGFLLLAGVQVAVSALRSWVVLYLGTMLNLQWLANVFSHLLRLPVSYFEKRHLGDVVSRFGAVGNIQRTLTSSFVEAMIDGLMAAVTLGMMLAYSGLLTMVAVASVTAYGLLRWVFYDPLRRATEEHIVHTAKQQSHFLETVRGVQSIKLFGRQEERRSRWLNLVVDATNRDLATQKLSLGFRSANGLVFGAERVTVIWIGALLVLDNAFSVGMLFAFVAYKEQFSARVGGLIDKMIELRMLNLQAERLADIVLTPPEEAGPAHAPDEIDASLEVRDLSFRYSDSEPFVVRNCSFRIEPGESVAIVGPSGGGKTTLLKLMLGLLSPTDGKILAGGIDIEKLGIDHYRKLVGTVMQDDQLFAGSIADNVSFFDPTPSQEAVERCARLAAVHDDIAAMPMGYNTLIGDMGAALSGGQRQRILLARALYKQPRILFLDEATSALDVQKERAVNDAIRELALTRILIAHRPETIASAGRVIVLQGGRVSQDLRQVPPAPASRGSTPPPGPATRTA